MAKQVKALVATLTRETNIRGSDMFSRGDDTSIQRTFYQHALSIHPINTPFQHALSTCPLTITLLTTTTYVAPTCSHEVITHLFNTHPINTTCQYTLSTRPINIPSHNNIPTNNIRGSDMFSRGDALNNIILSHQLTSHFFRTISPSHICN